MAELGSYYITIMPSMKGFTQEVKSQLGGLGTSGGKTFSNGFVDVLKGSAIGTALGNLASKAGSYLLDGLDVGIHRLDTIQNFPRVMESLGYSADEAGKSIKAIMDHLDGLPTATQDMVTLTQAISDSTGDLDLATRAALGFNDMMLANGASTAEMVNAQGVLNRVLGKGSATVAQWQSLTSVMPAQLGTVAKHMLGAQASTEDLHAALEDGTVSWNDFLRAIADLDKSGYIDEAGRQLGSFEEQARANSDGIGTAIDNIKNRIGAGWAAILESLGRSDISGMINTVSYGIKDAMTRIAEAITYIKDAIAQTSIGENLQIIGGAIKDFFANLVSGSPEMLRTLADNLIHLIDGALQWVVDHGDLVCTILTSMAAAFAFKQGLSGVQFLADMGKQLGNLASLLPIKGLGELPTVFKLVSDSGGPLSGLFGSLSTGASGLLTPINELFPAFSGLAAPIGIAIAAVAGIAAVIKHLWDTSESFRDIVTGIWDRVCETFSAAGERIGTALSGIVEKVSPILDKLGELFDFVCQVLEPFITMAIDTIASAIEGIVTTISGVIQTISGIFEGFTTGNWQPFLDGLKSIWDGIWSTLSAPVEAIFDAVTGTVGEFTDAVSQGWEDFKTGASQTWDNIKSTAKSAWNDLKTNVITTVGNMVDDNLQRWEKFKSDFGTATQNLANDLKNKWNDIKTNVGNAVENLKTSASEKWEQLKSNIGTTVSNIKTDVETKWNDIKSTVGNAVENLKTAASEKWDQLKTAIGSTVESIKTNVETTWNNITSAVGNAVENARSTVENVWNAISTTVGSVVDNIRNNIEGGLQAAHDTVFGIFDSIKNTIEDKINAAKNVVSDVIEGIKGLFNFEFHWPHIPLPHIEWHWQDLGGILQLPVFDGISWYAKGGVFDTATLIGIGEKGKEAALPLNDKTYGEIARGIVRHTGESQRNTIITGNTFYVREEADMERIAEYIVREQRRGLVAMT